MGVPSNRSPSPLSSRPNLHSRNSESNSTIRRSFNGNPFHRPSVLTNPKSFNPVTPANSPAGFGRRNSVGKEGIGQLQSCDEKENDKDQMLKPVKVRSPVNGSKNFMSPTISAASKFTPSPRKKALVERNDPVRTSISLSDGKATFFSAISSENTEDFVPKSELLVKQKGEDCLESDDPHLDQKEAILECPPSSRAMKRVTFAELPSDSEKASGLRSDTAITDSDCLNVDSNPKNKPSCFSASSVIAPLDADPSLPPYDPKTNFLSPRPQFLHYRPNPRIEVLLNNKEKGLDSGEVKRLEDSFTLESSSETFSDTDGTEESNSEDSHKDSEDSSSAEAEELEVKEGLHVSESSLFSTTISHEISEKEELQVSENLDISTPISQEIPEKTVGGKGKEKRMLFTSLKFVSLLMIFLIGSMSISVTNSPVVDSSRFLNFSKLHLPSEVAETAKANFDAFSVTFKQLSLNSISHLSMLINNLGRHDKLSPLQFINLTELQKDILVGGYLQVSESSPIGPPVTHEVSDKVIGGKGSEKLTGTFEKDKLEEEEDGETLPFEEETYTGDVSDDTNDAESDGQIGLGTQELTYTPTPVAKMKEPESLETVWSQEEAASDADTELKCRINSKHVDPVSVAPEVKSEEKAPEIQPELLETTKLEGSIDLGFRAKVESSSVDNDLKIISDITHSIVERRHSEIMESLIGGSQNMAYHIAGVISILLALISAAAYIYLKRGNASNPNPVVYPDQLLSKKKSPASSVLKQMRQEGPSSQNWPTEIDVMGASCHSEMSSFQNSSSHSRLTSTNEAQSQERKPREHSKRESLASSSEYSMDSPSYGSFTTYEKIPSKHANGDDEIMTPVRRSSRIRNLVTSP